MIVRAKELCFVGGSRRRIGDVFEYEGKLPKYLEAVSGQETVAEVSPAEPYAHLDNGELRVKLAEAGYKVPPTSQRSFLVKKAQEAGIRG